MRRSQFDFGSQPFRNLYTNPNFEGVGGQLNTRTNYILNPSTETTGSSVVINTNICTNPTFALSTTSWVNLGSSAASMDVSTEQAHYGTTSLKRTVTSLGGSANTGVKHLISVGVAAGETISWSLWVYSPQALSVRPYWERSSPYSGGSGGTITVLQPNTWTKLVGTYTFSSAQAGDASATFGFGFLCDNPQVGDTYYVDECYIHQGALGSMPNFFSGDTPLQNLLANPTFAANTTNWTTVSANITRVTNQGGDGHAAELTQTASGSIRNTAIAIMGTTYGPGQYTVAFDVKASDASFTNVRSLLYEQGTASVRASAAVACTKDGEWHRYSFQFVADGTWDRVYMELQGVGIPLGTKCWIDRAIVERHHTSGDYYEGTGDFTYDWTGTANGSWSRQIGLAVHNRSYLTPNTAYSTKMKVLTGTRSGAVNIREATGTTQTLAYPGTDYAIGSTSTSTQLVANTTYTWSMYVWCPAGTAVKLMESGTSLQGTPSSLTEQWERISVTFTTGASGSATIYPRLRSHGVIPAGKTIYWTNELLEVSPVVQPYFDGTTAPAGDFAYHWGGTAHASNSHQRVNVTLNGTGVNAVGIASTEYALTGTKSLRIFPTGHTSTDCFWAPGGDTGALRLGMEPGKTYTAIATIRQDSVLTGTLRSATPVNITAFWRLNGSYSSKASTAKVNAIGTETLRVTFTVPIGATEAFVRLYHGGRGGAGEIYVGNFTLTEGAYEGLHIDGGKPFSKWEGTPQASTSISYPPALHEIAGKPAAELIGIGNTPDTTVDAFAPRTIYFVYETMSNASSSWATPAYYGKDAPTSGITLQTSTADSLNMSPRLDFPGGTINRNIGYTNGRTLSRRHIFGISFPQGLGSYITIGDGTPRSSATIDPGTGWTNGMLRMYDRTNIKGVYMSVYYAEHSADTLLAISRYLGNKYGATVA